KRFGEPPGKERADLPEVAKFPGKLPEFLGKDAPGKRTVDNLLECVEQLKKINEQEYLARIGKLLAALRSKTDATNKITKVMTMDTLPKPRETFMLVKGAYDKPTEVKLT